VLPRKLRWQPDPSRSDEILLEHLGREHRCLMPRCRVMSLRAVFFFCG
jgi:hypothetical protein